jgi:mannose-6-phosphate isomerase-like protein (cupin superfamily)
VRESLAAVGRDEEGTTMISNDAPKNAAVVFPLTRVFEGASSLSITRVVIDGRHRELSSARSARVYFVVRGTLLFILDSGEPTMFGAEELLVIPRGCVYSLAGRATYLVINTPAFESGDDIYTE